MGNIIADHNQDRGEIQKQLSTDFCEGVVLCRDATSTEIGSESAPSLLPGSHPEMAPQGAVDPLCQMDKKGAATIDFSFFVKNASTGGTGELKLYGFPRSMPAKRDSHNDTTQRVAVGRLLAHITLTFDGQTYANIHPVLGTDVASSTFYEADEITVTWVLDSDIVRVLGTGGSHSILRLVDTCGLNGFYWEWVAIGGSATRGIVGGLRVG
jgi:hypothetical protein